VSGAVGGYSGTQAGTQSSQSSQLPRPQSSQRSPLAQSESDSQAPPDFERTRLNQHEEDRAHRARTSRSRRMTRL